MSDLPIPVLFREDPVVPIDNTSAGIGIQRRRPQRPRRLDLFCQLVDGSCLAAFDAGLYGQYVLGPSVRAIANASRGAR